MAHRVAAPDTPYFKAVLELFARLAASFATPLPQPVRAVLVGGAAVHVHTQRRVSADAEALFSRRVLLPQDLVVEWRDEHAISHVLAYDYNYFGDLGLVHPDAVADAWILMTQPDPARLELGVLAPVDLVLSKIVRWGAQDREDVAALFSVAAIKAEALLARADEALGYYVGDDAPIRARLRRLADGIAREPAR